MNMESIPVTWGDLIKIVLFLLASGVMFYLILAIANLVGILRNANKILAKNRANIDSTLEKLPEITENVTRVSDILKDEMESIQKIMGNVGKISDSAKDAVELLKKDILVKAKNIMDLIDWIRKLFQDKNGKKKEIVYKYRYKPSAETVEEEVTETSGKKTPDNDETPEQESPEQEMAKQNPLDMEDSGQAPEPDIAEGTQKGENEQGAGI
jgi:hypothetical protein